MEKRLDKPCYCCYNKCMLNKKGKEMIEEKMINGLRGTHIATGIPTIIPMNYKEMQLALGSLGTEEVQGNVNDLWDLCCESVLARSGTEIIGQIEIDYIVVDGVKKTFH